MNENVAINRLFKLAELGDPEAARELLNLADRIEDADLWDEVARMVGLAGLSSWRHKLLVCDAGNVLHPLYSEGMRDGLFRERPELLDLLYLAVINPVERRESTAHRHKRVDEIGRLNKLVEEMERVSAAIHAKARQGAFWVMRPDCAVRIDRWQRRMRTQAEGVRKLRRQHESLQGFLNQYRGPKAKMRKRGRKRRKRC